MAIYSLLNQSEQNTNADFSRMQTNFISGAGVVDLDGGDCEVTENGIPNLSVNIAAGSGYILNDSWTQNSGLVQFVEYENTATENVAINSNSSGNPRITSIFAKFDASANPGTRSDGSVSFVAIDGTASATPSAPAVPSDGNSYDLLTHVTVSNGASSITNSDISDERSQALISKGRIESLNADDIVLECGVRVYLSSTQATSGGATEILEFDTEALDLGSDFNTSTYRFTAPVTGYYQVSGKLFINNPSNGDGAAIELCKNGNSTPIVEARAVGIDGTFDPSGSFAEIIQLDENDYLEWYIDPIGADQDVVAGERFTSASIYLVGV